MPDEPRSDGASWIVTGIFALLGCAAFGAILGLLFPAR